MTKREHSQLLFLSGRDFGRVVWVDSLYELLGVAPTASRNEIGCAYGLRVAYDRLRPRAALAEDAGC